MTNVSRETFTCVRCRRTFLKIRPDAEALAEMEATYGPAPPDQVATLCDDCHERFLAWQARQPRH